MAFLMSLSLALCLVAGVYARRSMHEIQVSKQLQLFNEDVYKVSTLDGSNLKLETTTAAPPRVYWENASLPVDYSGKHPGNFTNRYWVVDQYYEPGSPVFVLDTGESGGGDKYLQFMTNTASFFNQFLLGFKGLGIVWEHRYYGGSLPFPVNLNTTSEQMQYLTGENALKDFDVFANQFAWKDYEVNPKKTPWVVMGGSYPGMRAAFLRFLYPETVYASYAASPPVEAKKDMSVYFDQVYRGMVAYGLKNCTEHVKSAIDYIDFQISLGPSTAAKIKQAFLGRTAEKNSDAGFTDVLVFPFYNWQSLGIDPILRGFCDHLSADDHTSAPRNSSLQGKYYADRWVSWDGWTDLVNKNLDTGFCEGPRSNKTVQPDCKLDERFSSALSISWTWQYCTEWGYFQSTNLGPQALGSRYSSLQHQQDLCYRQFPDGLSSGLLLREPETARMNLLTDGWHMRPSNVFFTEGEYDPWRSLSPLSSEDFSPKFQVSQTIPKCGVSTARDTVFGYVLPNSQHCYDFKPGYTSAVQALELFTKALTEWLSCFKPRA